MLVQERIVKKCIGDLGDCEQIGALCTCILAITKSLHTRILRINSVCFCLFSIQSAGTFGIYICWVTCFSDLISIM
jgi:hypothetical protein